MDDHEVITISSDDEEPVVENNNSVSTEQVDQNPSIECIDIDNNDNVADDGQIPGPSNQVQNQISPQSQVVAAIEDLLRQLIYILKPDELQRVKDEYFRLLSMMNLTTSSNKVQELINLLRTVPQKIVSDPSKKWSQLASVQKFMESNNKTRKSTPRKGKTQVKIPIPKNPNLMSTEEKKQILEQQLETLANNIKENDEKAVDFDDEGDSAYLLRERMMKQWMKGYKLYCEGFDLNPSLDRPTEKKIKLSTDRIYPEIKAAIETHMNSKEMNFIPQYATIEDIVGDVNMSKNLNIPDVSVVARPIYKDIVQLVHSRRKQDFDMSVFAPKSDAAGDFVDPSEHDEELRKILEENSKQAKSEKDVFKLFIQKQMEKVKNAGGGGEDKKENCVEAVDEGSGDEISDNEDALSSDNTNDNDDDEKDEEIIDEEPSPSKDEQPDKTENEKHEQEVFIIDD